MNLPRAAALIIAFAAAALAAAAMAGRYVKGIDVTTDPLLVGALAASAVGAILSALFDAHRRGQVLDDQNAGLKRIAEVQKRSVERLQLMNAELKENEQRYKGLVDAQGDVILRKWPDGRLTFVNDAFCTVFGARREAVLGKLFAPGFHPEDPPPLLHDYAESGDLPRVRYDQRVRTTKGWRWFAWEDYAIRAEGGQLSEIQSVGRDITERKEVERTVRAARDRAEQMSKAKSLFLATMSHEIRTPMNGVIGMAGLLLETPMSPDQRAYALAVKQSGEALVELINDILDFSKIEAGGLELAREAFGMRAMIDQVTELLATRAHQKGIDIAACVDADVPDAMLGDEQRVRQILLNLAGNAIKFTETGGVTLRVSRAAPATETGGRGVMKLRFEIEDTGIGIPDDAKERIFGHFEQADSTHSRKFGGTGLGLAISKKIVEAMGGEIGVISAFGGGSIFWFTASLVPNRLAEALPPPPDLSHKRIVVISPSAILRETMVERLRQDGATVLGFPCAVEASVSLMAARTDAVLVDIALREGDAEDQLPAIKAWLPKDAALVVMLPPMHRGRIPALRAAGATAYHITPIRHGWLERRLAAALGGVRLEDGNRAFEPPPLVAVPAKDPESRGNGVHILVAEDNEINTLLTVSLIKRMGHNVDSVRDGAEALAALESKSDYDLVLMDVHMPGVDGIEATRRWREQEKKRGVSARQRMPVIALTASVMDEDRQNCRAAGMDDFLTKPLDPNALTAAIARWSRPRVRAA
jgi:PAS domain S-box-containing protein